MVDLVTRIPAEEVASCDSWLLPEMKSKKVVPAFRKKSSREAKRPEQSKESPASAVDDQAVKQEKAKQEAEEVITETITVEPMTAEKLQQITEDAEKEGYATGYADGLDNAKKDGHKQGLEAGKAEVDAMAQRLKKISDTFIQPLEDEHDKVEKQILDIVCHLTRSLIKKELQIDSSMILEVVKQSISMLQEEDRNISLVLNSQDVNLIKESLVDNELSITLEVDDDLLPGGCRLQSKNSTIDSSINHQLDKLLDDFAHQRYQKDDSIVEASINEESIEANPSNTNPSDINPSDATPSGADHSKKVPAEEERS
ncbi:MAG: flagellar assembly protein FliH [Candidatus Endobugula sp.]|jgi:flagellar assembly protein FliH